MLTFQCLALLPWPCLHSPSATHSCVTFSTLSLPRTARPSVVLTPSLRRSPIPPNFFVHSQWQFDFHATGLWSYPLLLVLPSLRPHTVPCPAPIHVPRMYPRLACPSWWVLVCRIAAYSELAVPSAWRMCSPWSPAAVSGLDPSASHRSGLFLQLCSWVPRLPISRDSPSSASAVCWATSGLGK